jgi:hypothetical protein
VVAVGLAGDYNHNGVVDAADYVVWRETDGTQAGYDTWRAHFGAVSAGIGAGSGAAADHSAVPEPSAALLIVVGVGLLCRFTRRGRLLNFADRRDICF